MLDAARRAFEQRTRDAQVADVVEDLVVAQGDVPGVRLVRWTCGRLAVGVVACRLDDTTELFVDVHPPGVVLLEVRHGGPPLTARTDQHGRAELHGVLPGPFSLVLEGLHGGDPERTQTSWIRL